MRQAVLLSVLLGSVLLSCKKEEDSGVDLGDPAEELILPDMDGIDLPSAFSDGVRLTLDVTLNQAWKANLA